MGLHSPPRPPASSITRTVCTQHVARVPHKQDRHAGMKCSGDEGKTHVYSLQDSSVSNSSSSPEPFSLRREYKTSEVIRYFWKPDIYCFLTRKKTAPVQSHHKSSDVCLCVLCVCKWCVVSSCMGCGVSVVYAVCIVCVGVRGTRTLHTGYTCVT